MKRIMAAMCILLLLTGCALTPEQKLRQDGGSDSGDNASEAFDFKGIWISCFDMAELKNTEKDIFIEKVEDMYKKIEQWGFNQVFVQIRPFGDSYYPSEVFPWSSYISSAQGVSPGYDPLRIMVDTAHKYHLKFHAWINPYRVLLTQDYKALSQDNPARKYLEQEKGNDVFVCERGIYYNPCSVRMQKLILDGIREIVSGYPVDGIHIDDYFYPTTDTKIDEASYSAYLDKGGNLGLDDWRKQNVDCFVSGMYSTVKAVNQDVTVSVSPSADIDYNQSHLYADVERWATSEGYADILIPQAYFGFENQVNPFEKCIDRWMALTEKGKVDIAFGLAIYKCGEEDSFAGSGKMEWKENSDIIQRQLAYIHQKQCCGFSLFSYGYVNKFENQKDAEWLSAKTYINSIS